MSTNFPSSIDTLVNPSATDEVAVVSHAGQHANANDAIEALEAKVGADGSAVTTSHDYKLGEVTSTDKAVGKTATQTLANKTLTAPKFANGGFIADSAGNEQVKFSETSSAVNEITVANASTTNDPSITATGGDTNIGLKLKGKGSGKVKLGAIEFQFPNVDGTTGQVLTTDGAGVGSWSAVASPSAVTVIPDPVLRSDATFQDKTITGDTTKMYVGLVNIYQDITVNKVTIRIGSYSSSGTFKLALFSRTGATKLFEYTSASITATVTLTTTLGAPVALSAGQYYVAIVAVSGGFAPTVYDPNAILYDNLNAVSSEQTVNGYITVTSGTIPSTITPTSITAERDTLPVIRFDN